MLEALKRTIEDIGLKREYFEVVARVGKTPNEEVYTLVEKDGTEHKISQKFNSVLKKYHKSGACIKAMLSTYSAASSDCLHFKERNDALTRKRISIS